MKFQTHTNAELNHAQLEELANLLVTKRRELANGHDPGPDNSGSVLMRHYRTGDMLRR